jgi:hypothetical protein
MFAAGSRQNIDKVIRSGIVPRILELLQMDDHRARTLTFSFKLHDIISTW